MTEKILLELTFEELEIIDKYIELNSDTRQLFDKIRSAYPKSPVEVAYTEDIELYDPDEFLLDNIKSFHYEVMDEGEHVWMALYLENGRIGHLNIFTNCGKIKTRYEEWSKDL